jgi:hypothetical protein
MRQPLDGRPRQQDVAQVIGSDQRHAEWPSCPDRDGLPVQGGALESSPTAERGAGRPKAQETDALA